ncbi:MAG: hypothetical protein P1P87_14010, partial [Trueperaceae bacterium]|nr:hypothetical protein [Trueperaceae bacterium]
MAGPTAVRLPRQPVLEPWPAAAHAAAIAEHKNGLTYTDKYAVPCQTLPHDCRIDVVRVVLGTTAVAEYATFAEAVWTAFRVPLMKARVIVSRDAYLFSAIEPLP